MPRLEAKPENKKTQGVVSNIEHAESIDKANRLLKALKKAKGKQIIIPITKSISIEVSAKLSKEQIEKRVERFIYKHQIDRTKLLIKAMSFLVSEYLEVVEQE